MNTNTNFLDTAAIEFIGDAAAMDQLDQMLESESKRMELESECPEHDGKVARTYRVDMWTHFSRSVDYWRDMAKAAVQAIKGLSAIVDKNIDYGESERVIFEENCMRPLFSFEPPVYPCVFSLYADACTDIDRLATRIPEIAEAIIALSDELSLVDDYEELFPGYSHLDFDDIDNWDEDDYALDKERAFEEQDYGGWWSTWAGGDESNIEKLNSGKCLIAAIGKLLDSKHADEFRSISEDWDSLKDWIVEFVELVDKHDLWDEEDDVNAVRFALVGFIEAEILGSTEEPCQIPSLALSI